MQTWPWYKMPFSPNPFLPLHNIQRRFDFLGTQTRYFTGKHIRFGRSFTSQGARCSPHSCDEPKAVTSPHRRTFQCACAEWRQCRNMSQTEPYFQRRDRRKAAMCRLSPFQSVSQVSGQNVDELGIGRWLL